MTRYEQINKAAIESPNRENCNVNSYTLGYIEGAQWADENPDLLSRQGAIKNTIEWHKNRVTNLEALCEQLMGALEEIKNHHPNCDCMDSGGLANEALEHAKKVMDEK